MSILIIYYQYIKSKLKTDKNKLKADKIKYLISDDGDGNSDVLLNFIYTAAIV